MEHRLKLQVLFFKKNSLIHFLIVLWKVWCSNQKTVQSLLFSTFDAKKICCILFYFQKNLQVLNSQNISYLCDLAFGHFLVLILNIFYLLCWISFIAPGPRYDSYELWLFTNSTLCRASKSPTMCLSLGRVTSLSYQFIHELISSLIPRNF